MSARAEFERDLQTLSPGQLRRKYKKEETSHRNMKRRCQEAGFQLAEEWRHFRAFLRDMGPLPGPGHTLDRLDPRSLAYGPGLVRWADKATQTRNRTNTRWVSFRGRDLTLAEFAAEIEVPYKTIYAALERGETAEQIARRRGRGRKVSGWNPPPPIPAEAFWAGYEAWRARLLPEFRYLDRPELYFLVRCYELFDEADRALGRAGFHTLKADDPERERISEGGLAGDWSFARRHILEALALLRAEDAPLAKRLTAETGAEFARLASLHKRAVRPA